MNDERKPAAVSLASATPATAAEPAARIWVTTLMFSITGLLAITVVPWYGFTYGYSAGAWIAFGVLLWANGLSITGGYHRLWSHKTYEAHWSLRLFYAIFGAMALQNSILVWASGHRVHHRHVDDNEKDPYSAKRGFWFSHIGWMLREYPSGRVDFGNVNDLKRDPIVMFQHRWYLPLVLLTNIGIPVALGLALGDVWGYFLMAGILRLVVNHHVTFFINSLAHIWGRRPYTDENTARDNDLLAFFTYGEGYHNYHHIFQTDYRNGVRWFQWDPTKWMIAACSWVGLTWDLKRVSNFKIQRAVVSMQFKRAEQQAAQSGNVERWKHLLEQEYDAFRNTLNAFTELQMKRYDQKRRELATRWEHAAVRTRLKELEYSLRMQKHRLRILTKEMLRQPATAA
ncbi:MAG: acyl-CoA desaturase [Pseudomonadota bacterium]